MSRPCKSLNGLLSESTRLGAKHIALLIRARLPDGTETTTLVQQKKTGETLIEFCDYVTDMLVLTGLEPIHYNIVPAIQPKEFEQNGSD